MLFKYIVVQPLGGRISNPEDAQGVSGFAYIAGNSVRPITGDDSSISIWRRSKKPSAPGGVIV